MANSTVEQGVVTVFSERLGLSRTETLLSSSLLLILILCGALSVLKSQPVAWSAFFLTLIPAIGLFAVGCYIRCYKNQPRIAQLAIANSLFLGFMGLSTILIYLRFPIGQLTTDTLLLRADAVVGYVWPDFVEAVAGYPEIAGALRWVYLSSLPQLFALISILALTGRADTLNRALIAGSFSLMLTTLIWWLAPSVGPSAFFNLPEGLEEEIRLVTNSAYAQTLLYLSQNGLAIIAPEDILGTVAFPSYHTVMLLLVVWYLYKTPFFYPALALNLAMVPAILSHGGHHLTDMAGALAVFALSAWVAARPQLGSPIK